jgi:tetratricopeptide (TPR) repeat protein
MYGKTRIEMDNHEPAATDFLLAGADHAHAGRLQEAENAFAAAVLQDPQLHIARFQLGLLQWTMGRTGAALVTWQPLVALPAGTDVAHFARALSLWVASDLPGAAAQFREGLACCANEPLAQDMQKLLDTVADGQAQHVLLKNYTSGPLH